MNTHFLRTKLFWISTAAALACSGVAFFRLVPAGFGVEGAAIAAASMLFGVNWVCLLDSEREE